MPMYATFKRLICLAPLLMGSYASGEVLSLVKFDNTTTGWQGQNNPGSVQWQANAPLQVQFPAAGDQPPMPGLYASLVANHEFGNGAFVGNYRQSGVSLIGFDFKADGALPLNGVRIEIQSGNQSVYRDMRPQITQAGQWYRLIVRVDNRQAGGWLPVDDALFEHVLSNVSAVRIHVGHSYSGGASYQIGNLFLGGKHRTAGLHVGGDGQPEKLAWDGLIDLGESGYVATVYHVQTSTDLAVDAWETIGEFAANGGEIAEWFIPDTLKEEGAVSRFYRLMAH